MIGILITYYFVINNNIVIILLFFAICALVYNIIKGALNQRVILILFLLLGIFIGNNGVKSNLMDHIDKRLDYVGVIEEVLSREESFSKYIVSVRNVDNRSIPKEKIVLNISGSRDLGIGETIYFNGELKLPKENTNPRLFNYRLNLMTEKIYTAMSIKDHSIKEVDGINIAFRYRVKSNFIDVVSNTFNTYLSQKNASLMTGIFLGQSSYLSDEDIEIYRDMGLAHILAVSGLHIGIISAFIFFVLSNLGIKRKINVIITLSIIWLYGYLIGFPPSILRSSIMFTMLYYSQLIYEPYDSINAISFAMFILLMIHPYYLFNVGFQLSFAATFSIIILGPRIRERFYPFKNKIIQSFSSILGVQIGLLPFQAYYVNHINILSIIANLMMIPMVSIALILGFLMIIFTHIPYINTLISHILEEVLNFEAMILGHLQEIPMNSLKIFSPEIMAIIIFYLLLFVVFNIISIRKLKKPILKACVFYLIFLIGINTYLIIDDDSIELHFIDVGQGDAILIRTKTADYLMDTGGSLFGDYNIAEGITLPYLEKLGINRLDALFITHFDADHSQGVPLLLENMNIGYIFSTYLPEDEEILNGIKSKDVQSIILREEDQLKLDDTVALDIIWPKEISSLNSNNKSLVSILKTEGANILLTGDIEKEGEYFIKDKIHTSIDILKVPHHGSNTSSTDEFLQAIRPKDAIISVGRNNRYNHPSQDVLNRYDDMGIRVYRTDHMGLIRVIIEKGQYEIIPYLKDGKREKQDLIRFLYDNILYLMAYVICFMLIYIMVQISSYRGSEFYDL